MYLFLNKKQAELQEGGCFHTARDVKLEIVNFPLHHSSLLKRQISSRLILAGASQHALPHGA